MNLRAAVQTFIDAVYEHHDTKSWPHKYGMPYGAFNELTAALSKGKTMSKPLQDSAMLVSLNISKWTARKHDKAVSDEVDAKHSATKGGRFNKILIDPTALEHIDRIEGAARAYLYKVTFPWGDNGDRLLPAALFLEFASSIQTLRSEFDARTREFANEYPRLVQEARTRLGTLYDPADYPADVRSKFRFPAPSVTPVPSGADFRVDLNAEYVDSIKRDITERMNELQKGTVKECWARIRKVVAKIGELHEDSKIFDSVITNARELIDILPALNLTNDEELTRIATELQAILVPPDRLRQDKALKVDVSNKASAILAQMPA